MPVPLLKKIGTHTTLTNVSSGLPEIICWFVTVLASNAHSFEILEHTQLPSTVRTVQVQYDTP